MSSLSPDSSTMNRLSPRLAFCLLSIVGLLAYFNTFRGAFVFDDAVYIVPQELKDPFTNQLATVRPVASLTLSINYWLDGLNPRGYHLMNLAAHILAGWILFLLVHRTLTLPRFGDRFAGRAAGLAFVTALLWMVHPLQTQAVTYVIQRCESFAGLFLLMATYCYVRARTCESGCRWWWLGCGVAAVLAAGCKEHAIVLPAILACYEACFLARSWRAVIGKWWIFALVAIPAGLGFVMMMIRNSSADADETVGFDVALFTPRTYALTQTQAILHYLKLSIWPSQLCLDYIDWKPVQSIQESWPTVAALALMLVAGFVGMIRRTGWGFLAAWFFLILAPTSTFVPVQDAVVEHRMYLSLAAVVIGLVFLVDGLFSRLSIRYAFGIGKITRLAVCGVILLTIGLSLRTIVRNEDYSSALRLDQSTVSLRPMNFRARQALAHDWLKQGDADQALQEADRSLAIHPKFLPSKVLRGNALMEAGRVPEAVAYLTAVLKESPEDNQVLASLGRAELLAGAIPQAVVHLKRAEEVMPGDDRVQMLAAVALLADHQPEESAQALRRAVDLSPNLKTSLPAVARTTAMNRESLPSQKEFAVRLARTLLNADPTAENHDLLGMALASVGQFKEAVAEAKQAATMTDDPKFAARIRRRQHLFEQKKAFLPENLGEQTEVARK